MSTGLEPYIKRLNNAIQELNLEGDPAELYEPIRYIMALGGKRIRPILCLIAADLFDGDQEKATIAALSIEVFHNFTLVHDDIMDEAPLRRGQMTIHEKWNRDIAILSGDVMFVKAYELLVSTNSPYLVDLLRLFNQTAIEVCEGQQLDMNFESEKQVVLDRYLKMIELKTSVLLACSLKMGAIISGAAKEDAKHIYEFGRNLGIAFQIQDDYLDVYGDPDKFGKRVGGDIISNKKTFLLLSAIENASQNQLNKFQELARLSDHNKKVEETKALFEELGIPKKTEQAIESYYLLALEHLDKIKISEERKLPLKELSKQIMGRSY